MILNVRDADGRAEALVDFAHATDSTGRRYAPEWLSLRVLAPV